MANSHKTYGTAVKDKREMVISRIFKAPKEFVFKAWTDPEMIKEWWGPKGFTAPVIKVDLRNGGSYLYAMQGEDGKLYWSGGEYIKIEEPNQLVVTDYFSDEHGNKLSPADYGLDSSFPEESTVTVKFEDEKGKTKLSIIYELPESEAARKAIEHSGMNEGWNSSLDKLQELVEG
jgi:uncharacterized protein YndB with AHSA1/START domain